MKVTTIGHAGLLIEAGGSRILCDPWFNPAYLASWFPFPRNDRLDLSEVEHPDYLYVSHLHKDHFDAAFLRDHVDKGATILLPEHRLPLLETALREIGFSRFLPTRSGQPSDLGELSVTIVSLTAPTDGPIGDSALLVEDDSGRLVNLNDARPADIAPFLVGGRPDLLFLQTSGAIWYPMVYDFPEEEMAALGARKRHSGLERAARIVELFDPVFTVPFAGPPCFLDDDLFYLNDISSDPTNAFPDQKVFIDFMADRGDRAVKLMVPGSVGQLSEGTFDVTHPMPADEVDLVFQDKASYLRRYAQELKPKIGEIRSSLSQPEGDLVGGLSSWLEPLMRQGPRLCSEIGGNVVLDFGECAVLLDFRARKVGPWDGEHFDHRFSFALDVGQHLLGEKVEDWVNDAFLSCRFRASRTAPHNDAVFTFFKCLSPERMAYAEAWMAQQESEEEVVSLDGWTIQRRCPHAKADLARFGEVDGDLLTCHLHGYCYDLRTGECLTNPRLHIRAEPLGDRRSVEQSNLR